MRPGSTVSPRPGVPAPEPRVDYTPQLDRLAADLEAMNLEYEKFFNGALNVPPVQAKARAESQLRQLRTLNLTSAVDRFRLASLEARFTAFSELFGRRLRIKEEGRRQRPAPVERRDTPTFDPEVGVSLGSELEPAAVEALFNGLNRNATSPPRFDLDSFGTYLRTQIQSIQQKTGCQAVQFRVASEEGRLKLKARPLAGPRPETSR